MFSIILSRTLTKEVVGKEGPPNRIERVDQSCLLCAHIALANRLIDEKNGECKEKNGK